MTSSPRSKASVATTPFAVQVVALLIAGLVVAQLVNLAVVLLLPPPRPPIYTLGEIAAALEARPVQPRLGPPLVRAETASPPADSRMAPPRARRELAALLGAQPDAVRLSYNTAPMWAAALQHLVMLGRDPQDDMAGLHRRPFRRMDGPGFGPPTQDGPPQGGRLPVGLRRVGRRRWTGVSGLGRSVTRRNGHSMATSPPPCVCRTGAGPP